jgi:hypothetical protein
MRKSMIQVLLLIVVIFSLCGCRITPTPTGVYKTKTPIIITPTWDKTGVPCGTIPCGKVPTEKK